MSQIWNIARRIQSQFKKHFENLFSLLFFSTVLYWKIGIRGLIKVHCWLTNLRGKAAKSQWLSLKRNSNFTINQHEVFIVRSTTCPSLFYVLKRMEKCGARNCASLQRQHQIVYLSPESSDLSMLWTKDIMKRQDS